MLLKLRETDLQERARQRLPGYLAAIHAAPAAQAASSDLSAKAHGRRSFSEGDLATAEAPAGAKEDDWIVIDAETLADIRRRFLPPGLEIPDDIPACCGG